MVVTPSCAVTTVVSAFAPTVSVIGADALPDATVTPLTLTVAVASATVGVSVMLLTLLATVAV